MGEKNPGSASLQRDGAMVYVMRIAGGDGRDGVFPGTLDEISDLLGAAVRVRGEVSAQVVEYASYS